MEEATPGRRVVHVVDDDQSVRTALSRLLRTAHLETLHTPTLILQGTRDMFGTREEVQRYELSRAIRIEWIEAGDHSLKGGIPRAIEAAAVFNIEH